MSRLISCLFFLAVFAVAKGQHNYAEAMRQGDDAFNKRDYKTAINKYFAADAFDPAKKDEVKAKVDSVFDAIEKLRAEAERAERKAKDALAEAENAKQEADEQKKIVLARHLAAQA